MPVGLGYIVDGHSIPSNCHELYEKRHRFPATENPLETITATKALLHEAVANKRYTIPPKAVVEMPVGIFNRMELTEIEGRVLIAFRTEKDEYHCADVEPAHDVADFYFPRGGIHPDDQDIEFKESVEKAVKLLLAAVIRDFWVMEEREAIFGERQRSSPIQGAKYEGDKPRVVYLPRVRYRQQADLARCRTELGLEHRSKHSVAPHLRKAEQASEIQLVLARRYGFEVPKGYTFVRPHERGKATYDVVYRSRSALRSLYSVFEEEPHERTPVEWFQFERDVKALMDALGFTVQHVAALGRGDNGVDLYATKGTDLDQVNWVIQCKCWRSTNKVGPGVVQRLVGTLAEYPTGTRGMLVTTSSFTPKARTKAEENNIRLMDGQEFLTRVSGTNA